MNIRRALTSAALTTGLAATVLVAAPATQAHAAWSDCAVGKFCLFDGPNGGGPVFTDSVAPIWDRNIHDNNFGDRAESVWNRTGAWVCVYEHHYYGKVGGTFEGWSLAIAPGTAVNLNGLSNETSSYSIVKANENCFYPEPKL